jgi:hypothetical protein
MTLTVVFGALFSCPPFVLTQRHKAYMENKDDRLTLQKQNTMLER